MGYSWHGTRRKSSAEIDGHNLGKAWQRKQWRLLLDGRKATKDDFYFPADLQHPFPSKQDTIRNMPSLE